MKHTKTLFIFTILIISSTAYSQEWLLGAERDEVINQYIYDNKYKNKECYATIVRDTMITFTCNEDGFQQRAFIFHGDTCTKAWWATDLKNKNHLIEKYIGLNYNIHSYIKTINNNKAEISEFTNNRYIITIITYYASNIVFITSTFK